MRISRKTFNEITIKKMIIEPMKEKMKEIENYNKDEITTLTDKAIRFMKKNRSLIRKYEWAKQDFIQTDKEAIALYLTVMEVM